MGTVKTQKSKLWGSMLTGGLVIFSMTAFGQTAKTVKGEILDMSCYMTHDAQGKGHKTCAQGCLDKGLPAGILSKDDGQVYLLVEDHKLSDAYKEAVKHAAENVEITGKVVKKNGVQSLIVEKVKVSG